MTFHNSTIAFKRSQTNHRRKKKSRHLLSALVGIALCFIATGCSESASNHCVMNLRGIEAAKRQWRVENSKSEEDAPTWEEIGPYRGKLPKCPSNGIYKLGKVKEKPTCSKGGRVHKLPDSRETAHLVAGLGLQFAPANRSNWGTELDGVGNTTQFAKRTPFNSLRFGVVKTKNRPVQEPTRSRSRSRKEFTHSLTRSFTDCLGLAIG